MKAKCFSDTDMLREACLRPNKYSSLRGNLSLRKPQDKQRQACVQSLYGLHYLDKRVTLVM